MPGRPVPLELLELMRFIHPVMMLRRVMLLMSMRLMRAHDLLLFTGSHGGLGLSLLNVDLSGLLGEDVLETIFVPNEGIV